MKARNAELDVIKGICIIGIVFGHAGHALIWISYFFVFGFYFLGGITYREKTFFSFLSSKIKRIYIPFVLANLFALIVCPFLENTTKYSGGGYSWDFPINSILKFNLTESIMAPSWFLLPLFCVSFSFYFCKRVLKSNILLFICTFCIFVITVHYRNILQKIVWNNCAIIINLAIGLFLYTCGFLYYQNESLKKYIQEGKHAFDFFIISIIVLCEAKYYWNYQMDLRGGYISSGKWMLLTCIAGIYFLIYFSKLIKEYSICLKNILVYIGTRSMSIMLFHVMSFNIVTLIGIYILHDSYTVSWTNAFYGRWYEYVNAVVGIIVPLIVGYWIDKLIGGLRKLRFWITEYLSI